jgi:hypothetical protein
MIEEWEALVQEAYSLTWSLYYRRNESPRIERLYWRAWKRYERRNIVLDDCYRYRGMP